MTIQTDAPPEAADAMVDAALARRLRHGGPLRLKPPVTVTRPILRRYITVSKGERPAFRPSHVRRWDYFVLSEDAVALASLRQTDDELAFEGLTGGKTAHRLFQAVGLAAREFSGRRGTFRLRIVESHPARLLSVVLQPPSGEGCYVNVLDKTLLAEDALTVTAGLGGLRELARSRLAAVRARRPGAELY
jgi:hypothetical protein